MKRFFQRKRSGSRNGSTPKHGSWLNIAECELSALAAQCLGKRRIADIETLNSELKA